VAVRGDAELGGTRVVVQVQAVCSGSRDERSAGRRPVSFQSPWLLLALPLLGVAVCSGCSPSTRMRYAVQFTNLDVLATVVSGRSWLRLAAGVLRARARQPSSRSRGRRSSARSRRSARR
jgi:hypothetical protein